MRIIVDNGGYAMRNSGDTALIRACVNRLREQWPAAAVHVLTTEPAALQAAVPGAVPFDVGMTGMRQFTQTWGLVGALHRLFPQPLKAPLRRAESELRLRAPRACARWIASRMRRRGVDTAPLALFLDCLAAADAVVATGGGYFADPFAPHADSVARLLLLAARMGKPIALFGQGLGPLQSRETRGLLRRVARRAAVVGLRERVSGPSLLRELGCPTEHTIVTGDDAVELAYAARRDAPGTALGLNVRRSAYSGLDDGAAATLRAALKELCATLGAPWAPVPISWYAKESELAYIADIAGGLPAAEATAPDLDTVPGIVEQIAGCRVVITGSYHAGVFALSQGIPVVGLAASSYYSGKFRGLAGQFGDGCAVVALDEPEARAHLVHAVRNAWESAPSVRPALLQAARGQIEAGREAYARFARVVSSRQRGDSPRATH